MDRLFQRVEDLEDEVDVLKMKICRCHEATNIPGTSGSGSAKDPLVLDRAESPEYHTPPIASSPLASPITTPLEENFIPLPVRLDLGTSPSVDSEEENRPPCCQVPRLPLAPLLETSEDEVLTVSDIRQAIIH